MQLPYPLRRAGQRLLGGIPVRIATGPNRGHRWSAAALGRGYGSGSFGRARLAALACVTQPGDCFWDVGAHKGFVTLAAARWVGAEGRVVAVEPAEVNLSFLRRHLEWNRLENVEVLPRALGERAEEVAFGGDGSSVAFRLGRGPERVRVETIDGLVSSGRLPRPTILKIDVEGAEASVLRGTEERLGPDQALLISTHSPELYVECRDILSARGFRIFDSWEAAMRLAQARPWASDHDLLAIGTARPIDEGAVASLALLTKPSG